MKLKELVDKTSINNASEIPTKVIHYIVVSRDVVGLIGIDTVKTEELFSGKFFQLRNKKHSELWEKPVKHFSVRMRKDNQIGAEIEV